METKNHIARVKDDISKLLKIIDCIKIFLNILEE